MLQDVLGSLYGKSPTTPLYHYTSLAGLMGIVSSKAIWASEIKYLNDADELKYLGKCVRSSLAQRESSDATTTEVFRQFIEWTKERLDHGHMLFVCSFTESGNLLSQWRGYCPPGKGVSVGFNPDTIKAAADQQAFLIGKCVYGRQEQDKIITYLIDAVLSKALTDGPAPKNKKHPSQSYHAIFESLELDILRIAALLKNPAFREENEWRLVSPFHINYVNAPIKYREGPRMLVPYIEFKLSDGLSPAEFDNVFVGPTPDMALSFTSIQRFLSKYAKCPRISSSQLPYTGSH